MSQWKKPLVEKVNVSIGNFKQKKKTAEGKGLMIKISGEKKERLKKLKSLKGLRKIEH